LIGKAFPGLGVDAGGGREATIDQECGDVLCMRGYPKESTHRVWGRDPKHHVLRLAPTRAVEKHVCNGLQHIYLARKWGTWMGARIFDLGVCYRTNSRGAPRQRGCGLVERVV